MHPCHIKLMFCHWDFRHLKGVKRCLNGAWGSLGSVCDLANAHNSGKVSTSSGWHISAAIVGVNLLIHLRQCGLQSSSHHVCLTEALSITCYLILLSEHAWIESENVFIDSVSSAIGLHADMSSVWIMWYTVVTWPRYHHTTLIVVSRPETSG